MDTNLSFCTGQYGVPRPFYFLFTPSYWRSQPDILITTSDEYLKDDGKGKFDLHSRYTCTHL